MADVTLTYKGSDILELSNSGSATLKTGGKYCEDDIAVEYVKPSGGGVTTKFTGTVSFVDTDIAHGAFTVPISTPLTGTEKIFFAYRCVKTGKVADGAITWDESLIVPFSSGYWIPSGFGSNFYTDYDTGTVTGTNETSYGTKRSISNVAFRMAGTNNGGTTGGGQLQINLQNNSVSFGSGSSAYYYCKEGCATQYEYVIYILTDSGTPVSAFN